MIVKQNLGGNFGKPIITTKREETKENMKQKLTILLAVISLTTFGQNQALELKWKIGKTEKLNYVTVMSDIDTSSIEIDFGGLFKSLSDSSDTGLKESKNFFKKLNEAFKNQDLISTLTTKDNGIIYIVINTKPKEESKKTDMDTTDRKGAEVLKMMQSMTQGVMLRGSVYETGGIHSFWVKNAQKNLLALFFELPKKPINVGDKWSIDVNFIANDQNFECENSHKINEVSLAEIKKINGETIAVIKYNIIEYVKGNLNTPAFFGKEGGLKETMMKFTYQGIAEFSVDKGRWVNYDGIMSLEATGFMTANKKTKFTLIDKKNTNK